MTNTDNTSAAWTPDKGWHNVTEDERKALQAKAVQRITRGTTDEQITEWNEAQDRRESAPRATPGSKAIDKYLANLFPDRYDEQDDTDLSDDEYWRKVEADKDHSINDCKDALCPHQRLLGY